jgi:protein archease
LGYTGYVTSRGFEIVDHPADWAIRVHGHDLADLLRQAAAGFLSLADPVPVPGHAGARRQIHLQADDRETLLVRWLEELHYLLEAKGECPRSIELTVSPALELAASLEVAAVAKPGRAVKAVTYHGLQVADTADGLEAAIVFDV